MARTWTDERLLAQLQQREGVLRGTVNRLKSGRTILHAASENGHVRVVAYLLSLGADAAAVSSGGWTPLALAVRRHRFDVVKLLVSHGADYEQRLDVPGKPRPIDLGLPSERGRVAAAVAAGRKLFVYRRNLLVREAIGYQYAREEDQPPPDDRGRLPDVLLELVLAYVGG